MTTLKKFASGAALAAGMGAAVLGVGAGIANAVPGAGPGMIAQDHHGWGGGDDWNDHGRGHGWGHGRGWGGPVWNGPAPGVYINLPCATGPLGIVTVCP